MRFHDLVTTSRLVAGTTSRRAKIAHLAAALRALAPDEVETGVAFLSGRMRQRRLGVGAATLAALRVEPAREPTLALREVEGALSQIAEAAGAGSARVRDRALGALFARATREEQDFLGRLILGELRQGALEGLLLDAVARAAGAETSAVRRALMLCGDLGAVARAVVEQGGSGLARFTLEICRPLRPMLAETAASADEIPARLGRAALEYKLDGVRVQIHRDGDDVRVYSRHLNDVTAAVPELVATVRAFPLRRAVLDGELIALRSDGTPRPFQATMGRFGTRLDVARMSHELPLTPFLFDLIHLDGTDLLDRPGLERWDALASAVPERWRVRRRLVVGPADIEAFVAEALAAGHEGVMAKSLTAPYEAGRRGAAWLKLKPAHTLDLVVLAAEWGSGRRRGWLSNLHLGARDPASGGFVMLGKTFKGLTDDMLRAQTAKLLALETHRERHVVHVRPDLVVEIAFDGLQASPHYPGGLALRFARVRRYRPDKRAEEADTIDAVRSLHSQLTV